MTINDKIHHIYERKKNHKLISTDAEKASELNTHS